MDLADNDPTLFQTWLGAGNTSNTIEISPNTPAYATGNFDLVPATTE